MSELLDIQEFKNGRWLKIFYHNCTNRNYFIDENEAKYSVDSHKYSILGNITDSFKIGNKFEFILYYPLLEKYFHWRQSLNPLEDIENESKDHAKGFHLIFPYVSEEKYSFRGLVKSTIKDVYWNSLLDGNPGYEGWFYAIGVYNKSNYHWTQTGMPAIHPNTTTIVSLWILLKRNLSCKQCSSYSIPKCFFVVIIF